MMTVRWWLLLCTLGLASLVYATGTTGPRTGFPSYDYQELRWEVRHNLWGAFVEAEGCFSDVDCILRARDITCAALATPGNGSIRYCTDCQQSSPCACGGSGALARREAGAWNCGGGGGGSGDITDVWTVAAGNVNALTAAAGDTLNATSADSTAPCKSGTTPPATCTESQCFHDTDAAPPSAELLWCTATNTWTAVGGGGGSGDITDVFNCASGDCTQLVAGASDVLDMSAGASSAPCKTGTTLPATCTEGQCFQDTDSAAPEVYWCTATNTWTTVGGTGSGDITDIWSCTTGNCNALAAVGGDTLNATAADSTAPCKTGTTLPATCSEGQCFQDTDAAAPEVYWCTATNTWTTLGGGGSGTITDVWTSPGPNVNALTATAGDTLNATAADSSAPCKSGTTLPATCLEGQCFQDTDSALPEIYWCTATNTWTAVGSGASSGGWTETTAYVSAAKNIEAIKSGPAPGLRLESSDSAYAGLYASDGAGGVLSAGGLVVLPRGQTVLVGQHYEVSPRTSRYYKVTVPGTTANMQAPGFPISRYNEQRLALNQRVMQHYAANAFYHEVTSVTGGTCAADCSNAGTACAVHATCTSCGTSGSFGCGCTTAANWPTSTCFTSPTAGCTFSDGSCNYTTSAMSPGADTVTDGGATLAYVGWDAARAAPSFIQGRGPRSDEPQFRFMSGDNQTHQIRVERSYFFFDQPTREHQQGQEWTLNVTGYPVDSITPNVLMGAVGGGTHVLGVRTMPRAIHTGGPTSQDAVGSPPQLKPGLALAAGGSLVVGFNYCFVQSWIDRVTAGKSPVSPTACIKPTAGNQKIVVTPRIIASGLSTSPRGAPLIAISANQGNRYEEVARVASAADSITVTQDSQLAESILSLEFNTSGDPAFDVFTEPAFAQTWSSGLAVSVYESAIRPSNPWGSTPPVPFRYLVVAAGCDTNCKNCTSIGRLAAGTTGGSEPAWRTDGDLFCGTEAAGSKVQYQRQGHDQQRVVVPYNPFSDGPNAGEFGIYRIDSTGYSYLMRTIKGRPQYVCNTEVKPACNGTTRGLMWYTCEPPGNDEPDRVEYCFQDQQGNFAWVSSFVTTESVPGNTASISPVDLVFAPGDSWYRAGCNITVTTAATTSASIPQCYVRYTDAPTGIVKEVPVAQVNQRFGCSANLVACTSNVECCSGRCSTTCSGNPSTGQAVSGTVVFKALNGTGVAYAAAGYASTPASTMQYKLDFTLERIR